MRPIDLIPPEDREGQRAPLRTGPLAYIVIGALVLVLVGVAALVLTNNEIADRKSEVTRLEREDAAATAEAKRLAAYTQLQALHAARLVTITSLADSRFDWERVMRELALILPHDVWLVSLDASASAESAETESSGGGGTLRASIPGPALEISGCTVGQEGVAGFVTALKEIDGVTRVGIESSELAEQKEGAGSTSGAQSGDTSQDCRTRGFITLFQLTVAFDAAPVPATGAEVEVAPPAETAATPTETPEGG
jgi:Tfp pilus assembly protein PilN